MINNINADVVVIGGGPAGLNAAIAAGRTGAKTVLIERYGFLGGMSTIALVYPWMTFHAEDGRQVIRGIAQEIIDRLMALGASPGHLRDTVGFVRTVTPYDPEIYKVLAMDMLHEAGVKLLLHSFVDEVQTEDNRIISITLTGKSGRFQVSGRVFVDTTGDADVAHLAGAPCELGRMGDGLTQPMTMKFRMKGVNVPAVKQYMIDHPDEFYYKTPFQELAQLPLTAVGGFSRHWKEWGPAIPRSDVLFFIGPADDEVLVNTTRVQGLDGTQVEDLTKAEEISRKQVLQVAEFMKKYLPGFEKATISQVGAQIGVRETRRIKGQYMLTMDDVIEGKKFPDVIGRSGYPIDLHDPKGNGVKAAWIQGDGTYDIPYGCLLPIKIVNLLAAGRCISTTHEALGTTRLSPSCMATGQAAGTAAALSLSYGDEPKNVPIEKLQHLLRANGVILNDADCRCEEAWDE
ncbi:FAD-dependent oxidoreductase [Paenibacillus roseipurpureus]|uniref:FAD-dependent oxidoreductase n=1 Tax=Paenibacillus roseopurpureus TaxID=2918901 RepID=A0AA96LJH1_9BACL|nr:FAD-dependent oxidoreductase [Paenibacillus sp. MBLB1832]WNR42870.1 FAD-dependent oxidoreductase [Paenibacillus sp. MBLB1832]